MKTASRAPQELKLSGQIVSLRPIRVADATEEYCRWMNDPEVNRYLESRFRTHTVQDIAEYISNILSHTDDYLFLAIIANDSKKHIGNIKIGPINAYHRFAEVGIIIGEKSYWGKGCATEAIQLASDYAFKELGLHSLTAGAYKPNTGSTKAFEKAGYQFESTQIKKWRYENRYVDGIVLARINPFEGK